MGTTVAERPVPADDPLAALRKAWIERVLAIRIGDERGVDTASGNESAVVRLAKAMIAWNEMRVQVGREVSKLQAAILEAHEGEDDYDDIDDNIGNLDDILEHLDDRLIDKLNDMRAATSEAEKAKLLQEARGVLQGYRAYLASDPLVNDIDDNGYIKLEVKPLIASTLESVAAAL